MTIEKRIRLASAAIVFAAGALMAAEPAAALGEWEDCDCFENYAFWYEAVNDCNGLGGPPYYCVQNFSCRRHPLLPSPGYDYHVYWSCQSNGETQCQYDDPEFCT